jgi:hypothetical protein
MWQFIIDNLSISANFFFHFFTSLDKWSFMAIAYATVSVDSFFAIRYSFVLTSIEYTPSDFFSLYCSKLLLQIEKSIADGMDPDHTARRRRLVANTLCWFCRDAA